MFLLLLLSQVLLLGRQEMFVVGNVYICYDCLILEEVNLLRGSLYNDLCVYFVNGGRKATA